MNLILLGVVCFGGIAFGTVNGLRAMISLRSANLLRTLNSSSVMNIPWSVNPLDPTLFLIYRSLTDFYLTSSILAENTLFFSLDLQP